eukprot:2583335-Prymnesium_polylepis.1
MSSIYIVDGPRVSYIPQWQSSCSALLMVLSFTSSCTIRYQERSSYHICIQVNSTKGARRAGTLFGALGCR